MPLIPGPALYRDFHHQADIDQAYDPAWNVPDLAAIRQGLAEQVELARQTLTCVPDIPYGPTLDESLDIFPAATPGAPVLVYLHGGYWRAFSSRDFHCVALGPAALGMTVVVVNYALCPKVSLDEVTRQARASVAWVLRNIAQYHGDPQRIVLAGHSAGAHLAAMCLQTRWRHDYGLDAAAIRAALLVSGIYDIAPLRYSYLQPLIQLDDGIIRRNNPMFGVQPSAARVLLTWGGNESTEFARQSGDFLAQWRAAGNVGDALEQPQGNHFTAIHGFQRPDSPLCQWLSGAA